MSLTTDHPPATSRVDWTCPFCSLLCEGLALTDGRLAGSTCPRALAALATHQPAPGAAHDPVLCAIDGQAAPWADSLDAAAARLAAWSQPLFGGLGTDIAGARALYRLAARCGAICDHADGGTLMAGVRAVQDRGQYVATLGELRSRAELVVLVGTDAVTRYPEFLRRAGLGDADSPCRTLVVLGASAPAFTGTAPALITLPGSGDLHADVQQLAALVDARHVRQSDPALADLAARLLASPYSVLVWEGATLPREGELIIEALNRIVGTLNRRTRAATFGLGGSDGAFSVNQTFTWLSGLPLRTRVSATGLQHEPRVYDSARLLAQKSVDGLLWVSSFDPNRVPPATDLPRIVLGPPAMYAALAAAQPNTVFIAVATPGLNAAGHLFRTDGPVVLPVFAARDDGLPGVAQVLTQLAERVEARA